MSESNDVYESYIPFAALDPPNVVAVQVCELRQLLLGEATFEPERPHTLSKQNPWVRSRHQGII